MNNVVLYVLTVLIWGSTWYAITFQLGPVHPALSISYRCVLASILLLLFLIFIKKDRHLTFTPYQHVFMALQGLSLFSLGYILFYFGSNYLTSGLVAVMFSTITLMNVFNQALFFKIKVKKQVVLGSFIGIVGIALVFWPEISKVRDADSVITGIIYCIVAAYVASLGNILSIKNNRNNVPLLKANIIGMAYGAVFSFLIALGMGVDINFDYSPGYVLSLLYLAIFGSAVAFGSYLTLVRNIGADKAAYAAVLFPLVALLISTVFEGYVWTYSALLGVFFTIIGNVIAMVEYSRLILVLDIVTRRLCTDFVHCVPRALSRNYLKRLYKHVRKR